MNITFVIPSVGKTNKSGYVKSWLMEPLSIAVLSALTPYGINKKFFDDRLEDIDYDYPTDIAAISLETYTAKRAYQIAEKYRAKGITVVMGGFHATLCPDEALMHCNAVVEGEAEDTWKVLLDDFGKGGLKRRYSRRKRPDLDGIIPDRSIYKDKKYLSISLIETGRGCPYGCDFCSIAGFYRKTYSCKPIEQVINEIMSLKAGTIFFVDDNIASNVKRTKELLKALIPLKIKWSGQISINSGNDDELLSLLKQSGCQMLLVGFESLNGGNLKAMNKNINATNSDYEYIISRFRDYGISIYATFAFGYENDTKESIKETMDFAIRNKFFLCAINHVVPFPGTDLYERLKRENRLIHAEWWLDPGYSFGDVAFYPKNMTYEELKNFCYKYRRRFYSISSIFKRMEFKANLNCIYKALMYFIINFFNGAQVKTRQGLRLGERHDG